MNYDTNTDHKAIFYAHIAPIMHLIFKYLAGHALDECLWHAVLFLSFTPFEFYSGEKPVMYLSPLKNGNKQPLPVQSLYEHHPVGI